MSLNINKPRSLWKLFLKTELIVLALGIVLFLANLFFFSYDGNCQGIPVSVPCSRPEYINEKLIWSLILVPGTFIYFLPFLVGYNILVIILYIADVKEDGGN
jgi:hypothetical protein